MSVSLPFSLLRASEFGEGDRNPRIQLPEMIASDCERGLPSARSGVLMRSAVTDSSLMTPINHHLRHDHQQRQGEEKLEKSSDVVCESAAERIFSNSRPRTTKEGVNDLYRVCVDCRTTKTPLWRSGPAGPKSLCNACGIRYRKKRRRWVEVLIREEEKARSFQGREEAEAAVLLVALSCGFLFHQHPQP